jgi:hypothetical protein
MKRDFDLIRKILLNVEENHDGGIEIIETFEDYDNLTLMFHYELLIDIGLLKGSVLRVNTGEGHCICKGLTWFGYDYLAKIKDETVWKKTKKTIREQGVEFTIEIISRIATKLIEDRMGI